MYNKEDLIKLITNLKKVEAYCRENYIPHIPHKNDSISVDFGLLKSYPGQLARKPQFTFGMNGWGAIWLRIGGLCLYLDENCENSLYKCPIYGEDLLLNWSRVKSLIGAEITTRAARRKALDEFEV